MLKYLCLCCVLMSFVLGPMPALAKKNHKLDGLATWYGKPFHGRHAASGAIFNMHRPTAAHMTLPFGTVVEVHDQKKGHRTVVVVADRGPMSPRFCIDLSRAAGLELDLGTRGVTPAKIRVLSNTKGEMLNAAEAFYVQVRHKNHTNTENIGPFSNFKDAAVMQEVLKGVDSGAKIIVSTR